MVYTYRTAVNRAECVAAMKRIRVGRKKKHPEKRGVESPYEHTSAYKTCGTYEYEKTQQTTRRRMAFNFLRVLHLRTQTQGPFNGGRRT